MKLVLLPLDERPCNYDFPSMIIPESLGVELKLLPKNLIGQKKLPGDVNRISDWLFNELDNCDGAIISLEMLIYGGLLPSRIHQDSYETLKHRLDAFEHKLEQVNKTRPIPIYLYGLVMRTPAYSSSDEEPDYYEHYGEHLFRLGYFTHKAKTNQLTENELGFIEESKHIIPLEVLNDFEQRRDTNRRILVDAAKLFAKGLIKGFSIPQDDTAQFGYGPEDKEKIWKILQELGIATQTLTYPGADELGCSLVSQAIVEGFSRSPNHVNFMNGPKIWIAPLDVNQVDRIPKYESMPLLESCILQIKASGGQVAQSIEDSDIILGLNTGSDSVTEAYQQKPRDLLAYVKYLKELSETYNLPLSLADCAYPNGGDTDLVLTLDTLDLWNSLVSYAGWNTSGNTLGTAISQAVVSWQTRQITQSDYPKSQETIAYRVYDDWAYQTVIRITLNNQNLSNPHQICNRINLLVKQKLPRLSSWGYRVTALSFPWNRLFEISLNLEGPTHSPNEPTESFPGSLPIQT